MPLQLPKPVLERNEGKRLLQKGWALDKAAETSGDFEKKNGEISDMDQSPVPVRFLLLHYRAYHPYVLVTI